MNRGYSLVEILVALSVAVLVGGGIMAVYPAFKKGYKFGEIRTDVNQNARLAIDRICREIKGTSEIITALPESPSTPPTSTIFFRNQNTPISYTTYYLEGTDLKRKVTHYHIPPNYTNQVAYSPSAEETIESDAVIAQNITFLDFWGLNLVNINLTASSNDIEINLTTTCWPRNR